MTKYTYSTISESVLRMFPELGRELEPLHTNSDGYVMPYLLFGLILRPEIELALQKGDSTFLTKVFELLEAMALSDDREVVNLLYVEILEPWLGSPGGLTKFLRARLGIATMKLADTIRFESLYE